MLNLTFLPATAPGDTTYGVIPAQLPGAAVRQVRFDRLVWYNHAIQEQAVEQIAAWDVAPVVLVGFSKSGLGAWHIARAMPERVSATIIFDAPAARLQRPPWDTAAFYADDAAWQADIPVKTVCQFAAVMPPTHELVLIAGENFHEEMRTLSQTLDKVGLAHAYLHRPDLKHHWNSGWIEQGLNALRPRK